jgi:hypothetical protein
MTAKKSLTIDLIMHTCHLTSSLALVDCFSAVGDDDERRYRHSTATITVYSPDDDRSLSRMHA